MNNDPLSLAPFLEQMESALENISHEQLKQNVLAYAGELVPESRMSFYQFIALMDEGDVEESREFTDETLVDDVENFYIDIVRGQYDHEIDITDEESVPEWVDDMDVFFARTSAAFLKGQFEIASKSYSTLFEALNLAEDIAMDHQLYSAQDMILTNVDEEKARFLRANYACFDVSEAPNVMIDNMMTYQAIGRPTVNLRAIKDSSRDEMAKFDEFIDLWINALKSSRSAMAHDSFEAVTETLLREAVLLKGGVSALESLADEQGADHPEVFFDLITEFVGEENFNEAERIAAKGLEIVAEKHQKAVLADWLAELATKANHQDKALSSRKEAWRLEPSHERLVNWCTTNAGVLDDETLREEIEYLKDTVHRSNSRLICMLKLLIGEYEKPREEILCVDPIGWGPQNHPGHVVFPFLLIAGADVTEIPEDSSLKLFTEDMKSVFVRWQAHLVDDEQSQELHNYLEYLLEAINKHQANAADKDRFIATARTVILDRVRAIIRTGREELFEEAAHMAVAYAEVCFLSEQKERGLALISNLRTEFIKMPLFRSTVRHIFNDSSVLPHMSKLGSFNEYETAEV